MPLKSQKRRKKLRTSVPVAEGLASLSESVPEWPTVPGLLSLEGKLSPPEKLIVRTYLLHLLIWCDRHLRTSKIHAKGEPSTSQWAKALAYSQNQKSAIKFALQRVDDMVYGNRCTESEFESALNYAMKGK